MQVAAWVETGGNTSSKSDGLSLEMEMQFGDGDCTVAATDYLCSTNDKGGSGIGVRNYGGSVLNATGRAIPGRYEIQYTLETRTQGTSDRQAHMDCGKEEGTKAAFAAREVRVGPGH
jgi:hypothetical protein